MPQQIVRLEVPEELLGAGYWIEVRRRLKMKDLTLFAGFSRFANLSPAETLAAMDDVFAALGMIVVDWNLEDEEGQPLPSPKDNPEAFGELYVDTLTWLAGQIQGLFRLGEAS